MLSVAQLCDLEYTGPQPFQRGLTGEDARRYHREHGEEIRVWQGYAVPKGMTGPAGELRDRQGRIRIEQILAPEVRALISNARRDVFEAQFGTLPKGALQISTLPDEIQLALDDMVLLVEPHRAQIHRCVLEAGESALRHPWVSEIQCVLVDGGRLSEEFWSLQVLDDGNSALVLDTSATCSVSYKFQPLYVWNTLEVRFAPKGVDGSGLPQIGLLTQEMP